MQNILFVHHSNDLYGADIVLLETVKHLDRSVFTPLVILPADSEHIGRLAPRLVEQKIEVMFLPLAVMRRKYFKPRGIAGYFFELLGAVRSLRRIIRERRIDLVHTNTLAVTAGAFAAKLARVPHVWHVHEILVDPASIRKLMHRLVPGFSEVIVCISEAVGAHLLIDVPGAAPRIRVIPNGMNLARFLTQSDSPALIRAQYGIPNDAPLIGMIGKVTRLKGQLVFANAAKLILASAPNAHFLAVGGVFDNEHFYMENFVDEVTRLGLQERFHIVGYTPEVSGILQAFDIFVLPSTSPEPFGLVLIEAMASAKAIVATAHGGPSEIITPGQTGVLVEPSSPEAIAEAVLKLLADAHQRAKLGVAARKTALERFSIERYIGAFETLYQGL
jgi:glycosyltransferase involved in cell wall biosynthesis